MHYRTHCTWLLLWMLTATTVQSADITSQVPNDALGFIVVQNLASVDAKLAKLAELVQHNVPQPLSFLKAFAGIDVGLNPGGAFMLALFPAADGDEHIEFCVWLPVSDYDRFLASLGATSIDGVAAATIAGEDLLVAQRGEWALIMDPDQRERISQLVSSNASPPELPLDKSWIASNDVTVVALAAGIHSLFRWIGDGADDKSADPNARTDDLFGQRNQNPNRRTVVQYRSGRTVAETIEMAKASIRKWIDAAPEMTDAVSQATALGCGLQLDSSNNAIMSIRVAVSKELTEQLVAGGEIRDAELPFAMHTSDSFLWNGAGRLPQSVLSTFATAYARRAVADLNDEERTVLDEASVERLLEAVDKASAGVRSVHILSQPGEESQPVYSNEFVAVRVDSAEKFSGQAREVMRLWNSANRDAKGETRLVFDVMETKLGDRAAVEYSLDVAALEGGLVLPEVRQTMEKMFGPGGKLRVWIVPVDDTTVLCATATEGQVTNALKVIDQKRDLDWSRGQTAACNSLLPAESHWRLFFDPHRYTEWSRHEAAVIAGVPIIGGSTVRDFPASPPVGVAGGIRAGELWMDVAALAPTVKSADMFWARSRYRSNIQLRARILQAPPAPAPAPKK